MVQKQVTAQEWLRSTPEGRRPRIRRWRRVQLEDEEIENAYEGVEIKAT